MTQIKGAFVPNLNVAGFWDQEDPWGPWEIYRRSEASDPNRYNFIVAGPWFHGQWHNLKAESIGQISFGGHDTAAEFREKIEAPWFRYWLHGKGEKFPWKASTFQTGSNPLANLPDVAAERRPRPSSTCTPTARCRSTRRRPGDSYVQYVSDPANPVPYRRASDFADLSRRRLAAMGSRRISASSRTVRTWRRGSAVPSIATSPSPASWRRTCSRRRQAPTAISS